MQNIRIGLSHSHSCSYLPDRQERVAIAMDGDLHTPTQYEMLLANGFRRSGDTIYKPHCDNCQLCQAIRVSITAFDLSRSQKRLLNKSNQFHWEVKESLDPDWYSLYKRYINQRHHHGSMYPPNREDFAQFSSCSWLKTVYLHIYKAEQLVAIAVTDLLPQSASAFYTFYDPDEKLSLGTLAVLLQAQYCHQQQKTWLYLGYQIDECPAMNYKTRFQPHQRLVNQRWQG
ncbi:arginyltransferase [Vibrio spartinae]|uniref:Aspartate/glutamate leucyltransferase n=1 Tax=Vibrio spartinae TaxID=1918945 RepID=A0A1N6M678_9VIBR|nr:arginyltransferase [Vibrio spartinae]QMV14793.1 arginyl-tRNA-protein transferase [Vibrio spartinae]SIO94929.1 arginyl-tRNA-protein transferase [Vibrio spartinae]